MAEREERRLLVHLALCDFALPLELVVRIGEVGRVDDQDAHRLIGETFRFVEPRGQFEGDIRDADLKLRQVAALRLAEVFERHRERMPHVRRGPSVSNSNCTCALVLASRMHS
jgi:hypothetical protein